MAEYSTVAAIHTLWLTARAQGIGLGWVSILDPDVVVKVLDVPKEWRFIGYFASAIRYRRTTSPSCNASAGSARREGRRLILRR